MSDQYELIFEGPKDEKPETLQSIKNAFVADLEFSVQQVQEFLGACPATIQRASDQAEFAKIIWVLKKAGAKVSIRGEGGEEASLPDNPEEIATNSNSTEKKGLENSNEIAFELEEPGAKQEKEPEQTTEKQEEKEPASANSALSGISLKFDDGDRTAKKEENLETEEPKEPASFDTGLSFADDAEEEAPAEGQPSLTLSPKEQPAETSTDLGLSFEEDIPQTDQKESTTEQSEESAKNTSDDLSFEVEEETEGEPVKESPKEESIEENHDDGDTNDENDDQATGNTDTNNIEESEYSAHNDAFELDIKAPVITKRPKQFPIPLDICVPVVIGSIILAMGNWLAYLNDDLGINDETLTQALSNFHQKTIEKIEIDDTTEYIPTVHRYNGSAKNDKGESSIELITESDLVRRIIVEFVGIQPDPLSPEEIVRDIEPRIWVKRIDLNSLKLRRKKEKKAAESTKTSKEEKSTEKAESLAKENSEKKPEEKKQKKQNEYFIATGNARVYLEQSFQNEEIRKRIIANAKLKGKYVKDNKKLYIQLEVYTPDVAPFDKPEMLVEKDQNGAYSFALLTKHEIDLLEYVPEIKPEEGEQSLLEEESSEQQKDQKDELQSEEDEEDFDFEF